MDRDDAREMDREVDSEIDREMNREVNSTSYKSFLRLFKLISLSSHSLISHVDIAAEIFRAIFQAATTEMLGNIAV